VRAADPLPGYSPNFRAIKTKIGYFASTSTATGQRDFAGRRHRSICVKPLAADYGNIPILQIEDSRMKLLPSHVAFLTAVGILAFMLTVASAAPRSKCMIDEGYGRYTPCEALYKSKRCMIEEGPGRYTPCEALVRQVKPKKKG
jgi:hypothetical protein